MARINIVTYTDYEGPYTVDPTESQQTLETLSKKATDNITVTEIPSTYGYVEADGDTLIFN